MIVTTFSAVSRTRRVLSVGLRRDSISFRLPLLTEHDRCCSLSVSL